MNFDVVIFDIDNVLIDTRASYTDCIRKTVAHYLETVFGFHAAREGLLSREDVERFKALGGFNDDWDTCHGLLNYFLSLKPKRKTLNELRKAKDETGIKKTAGQEPKITIEQIADLFQRFYLSEYRWNEALLIEKQALEALKRAGLKLGIVTGRNSEETLFSLKRFQIDSLIDKKVTLDDTPKGKKKPNPYGLIKIARDFGKELRYLYVGDLPDDMLAATQAAKKIKMSGCGFLACASDPAEMKKTLKSAGATYICDNMQDLIKTLAV